MKLQLWFTPITIFSWECKRVHALGVWTLFPAWDYMTGERREKSGWRVAIAAKQDFLHWIEVMGMEFHEGNSVVCSCLAEHQVSGTMWSEVRIQDGLKLPCKINIPINRYQSHARSTSRTSQNGQLKVYWACHYLACNPRNEEIYE